MTLARGKGNLFCMEDRAMLGSIPSALQAVKRLSPGEPSRTDPTALPQKAKTPGEARFPEWFYSSIIGGYPLYV